MLSFTAAITVISSLAVCAFAQPVYQRILPGEAYVPGREITVTIVVKGVRGIVTIAERPPDGWTISHVTRYGKVSGGTITWKIALLIGSATLKYRVTPPVDARGDAVFSGKLGDADITGDTVMSVLLPSAGKQVPVYSPSTFNYLLYLPAGYGVEGKKWPLMMFLHGAGEAGADINSVKKHGPPKLVESPGLLEAALGGRFGFVLVSPQLPSTSPPADVLHRLKALLDEVLTNYPLIDTGRMYLTGLSMGGYTSWWFASEYPELFAAIAPICGGGTFVADPGRLVDIPIWAFHGSADPVVPLSVGQAIVNAVRERGGNVKFTVYPGVGHDSWTQSYNNPDLYSWFLQHRKRPL